MSTFTPPMRNGITASCVYLPTDPTYPTYLDFLSKKFLHISRQEWQTRICDGLVFTENGHSIGLEDRYHGQQHLYYYRHLTTETEIPFAHSILFENEHIIVVDKPHFLVVSPTGQYVQQTLLTRLKHQFNNPELSPIHRLDRETAGLIVFSKKCVTRGQYQQLFAEKQIQKTYHAIAKYNPALHFPKRFSAYMCKGRPFYTMRIDEGVDNSHTDIAIIEKNQEWAKYQLTPITGKQHQLRVHMNALGLPLRYDTFYPEVQHAATDDFSKPLQLLAKQLSFRDPVSKVFFNFSSEQELLLPEGLV